MRVAAYQAPFLPSGSVEALGLIGQQIERCEAEGVEILCCPEGILGGLADYAPVPAAIALKVESGQLAAALAPLASETVSTILGFTEVTEDGRLYNSAAVLHRGSVTGLYRKMYPAINHSVYQAGDEASVFQVGGLTFGILIWNDSNFPELARTLAGLGATALFVPTNCGLPPKKAEVVAEARKCDLAMATENRVWVIRADVAGQADGKLSYGSSAITGPSGIVVRSAARMREDLLIAEIERN